MVWKHEMTMETLYSLLCPAGLLLIKQGDRPCRVHIYFKKITPCVVLHAEEIWESLLSLTGFERDPH
jgi:hypothetical protein